MRYAWLFLLVFLIGCTTTKTVFLETHTVPASYGELYGLHIGNVLIGAPNTYYNITNLTVGLTNNMNVVNDSFIINNAGVYRITSQISFSDSPNTEFHLAVGIDGMRPANCHTERKVGSNGDVGSASVTCLLNLSVDDRVTVMMENPGDTNNPDVHAININLVELI